MKIIKRNGAEAEFDKSKIITAVSKANQTVAETDRISDEKIAEIAQTIEKLGKAQKRALSVEEIQDKVEDGLMQCGAYNLARAYITYRYTRALARKANTTDGQILNLIEANNEEVKQENSNKNPITSLNNLTLFTLYMILNKSCNDTITNHLYQF